MNSALIVWIDSVFISQYITITKQKFINIVDQISFINNSLRSIMTIYYKSVTKLEQYSISRSTYLGCPCKDRERFDAVGHLIEVRLLQYHPRDSTERLDVVLQDVHTLCIQLAHKVYRWTVTWGKIVDIHEKSIPNPSFTWYSNKKYSWYYFTGTISLDRSNKLKPGGSLFRISCA